MTNQQHPITPPLEMLQQWASEYWGNPGECLGNGEKYIATKAAQWSADQELAACCVLMDEWGLDGEDLMQCRRPKSPSLKEQALLQLDTLNADLAMHGRGCDLSQIRRALKQLND